MAIKSDRWIREMATQNGMIEPFEESQVSDGVISYGLSSYGYDMRVADEFRIFHNALSPVVDPKSFDERSFVEYAGGECIIPPNSFALARSVEYFRIPRDIMTITVGKSTYARCFRGDTRVALVDGTAPTLEEMAQRADDGEMFWGYSLGRHGRVIVTLLDAPRFVGRDSLVEIGLDTGPSIRCTPDHGFVLRDGRLARADDLRPDDPLMPLYREAARGHEMVYQPTSGHLYPTHRLADEWNVRNGVHPEAPGTRRRHRDHDRRNDRRRWSPSTRTPRRRRHRDHDRRNDRPWNITRIPASEHVRHHEPDCHGEDSDAGEDGDAIRRAVSPARRKAHAGLRGRGGRRRRNHTVESIRTLAGDHDVYCLTVPEAGNFALASGVFVENCGIITNVTPFEPEWEGFVTLEISNTTPLPAKVYADEGIAQVLFFQADEPCEISYADRKGKYQGQKGVTTPRL